MNLFETLSKSKNDIGQLEEKRMILLHLITSHLNQIKKAKEQDIDQAKLLDLKSIKKPTRKWMNEQSIQ